MFPALLGLSLTGLAALGFVYCTLFWLGPWRKQRFYSAHAFTLINASLFIAAILIIGQQIHKIANGGCQCPFDLAISIVVFLTAFFSVAFARGYFIPKEKQE